MALEGLKVHKPFSKHSGIRRTDKQTYPRSPSATVLMHHRGIRRIVPQESLKLNTINANILQQPLNLDFACKFITAASPVAFLLRCVVML